MYSKGECECIYHMAYIQKTPPKLNKNEFIQAVEDGKERF